MFFFSANLDALLRFVFVRLVLNLLVCAVLMSLWLLGTGYANPCPTAAFKVVYPDLEPWLLQTLPKVLCNQRYDVLYSMRSAQPIFVVERLTRSMVQNARFLRRTNHFVRDPRIPMRFQPESHDFVHSGTDRGHLAPSGDMPTVRAQKETYRLTNIVPQNSEMNRNLWSSIEMITRNLALRYEEIYVVTGPLYLNGHQRVIGRRHLRVPTSLFKAIYIPKTQQASAYLAQNGPKFTWELISIEQLSLLLGATLFPKLSKPIRNTVVHLPDPTPVEAHFYHHR